MKKLWMKRCRGLNNRIDPVRLEYDPETGVQWLTEGWNVDLDGSGRVSRRKGWEQTGIAVPCHSIFSYGDTCLFVSNGQLCRLGTDLNYSTLRVVTPDARMTYAPVGDVIYFMNGLERGYVRNGVAGEWTLPAVIRGPETTRVYQAPPAGQIVSFFRGRVYVVSGNVVWYTEAYGPNLMDYTRNFLQFESVVQVFHPVKEGVFVGTTEKVWFLRGSGPNDFIWETGHLAPAVRGTAVDVTLSKIGEGELHGTGVLWTGSDGICLGLPDGTVLDLTRKAVSFSVGSKGAAIVMEDKYICTMLDTEEGKLTVVLNLDLTGLTQYLNYWFKGYAKFAGKYLGVSENGLAVLGEVDKDGDDQIVAGFGIPLTDFGLEGNKKVRFLELSYKTSGGIKVTPVADEVAGSEVELVPINKNVVQTMQKIPVGRYLGGRYWSLLVENLDGADFSIDKISVELAGFTPA